MEIRVFDKTVEPLGTIDEMASLLWHTKYFDVGSACLRRLRTITAVCW